MNKSLAKTEGMSLPVPIDSARRRGFSLSKVRSIRCSSAAEAVIHLEFSRHDRALPVFLFAKRFSVWQSHIWWGGIPNESREGLSWRVLRARTPVAPRFVV